MKNSPLNYLKQLNKFSSPALYTLAALAFLCAPEVFAADLSWSSAKNNGGDIGAWVNKIMLVLMSIFIMVSIVLGSLAFKQLAADGNWKDFWSKIAGAIGMFVVPIAVYYLITV
jgi:hypothetical protein